MTIITLVGKRQARQGVEFLYMGRTTKCIECPLRKVCCDKLEPNRVYTVISVRDRTHDCPIHEEGVQLVEVTEGERIIALPTPQIFEGAAFTFHGRSCDKRKCDYFDACNPVGLKEGDRCRVEAVIQRSGVKCGRRRKIGIARVRRVT
jgi:uncharacterized protein (UPF0179 family)